MLLNFGPILMNKASLECSCSVDVDRYLICGNQTNIGATLKSWLQSREIWKVGADAWLDGHVERVRCWERRRCAAAVFCSRVGISIVTPWGVYRLQIPTIGLHSNQWFTIATEAKMQKYVFWAFRAILSHFDFPSNHVIVA